MQALLYRAQSLRLIEKAQASWLWRQFSMARIRFSEPPELEFDPEQPGVLARMLRLHLDTFGYTVEEMARLFHLHEGQIGRYYNLSAGSPVTGMKLRIVRS